MVAVGSATPPTVFVALDRLVAAATEALAPPPPPLPPASATQWGVFLPPVPALDPVGEAVTAVARWRREWLEAVTREAQAAAQPPSERLGTPRLATPLPAPTGWSVTPAEWRFRVEQIQRQLFERARLRLRLSFADRLKAAERDQLQRRLAELDAALQAPLAPPPPLPPTPPVEPSPPVAPTPLTDEGQIAALVAPLPSAEQGREWLVAFPALEPFPTVDGRRALARDLRALARAFTRAYGWARGWQVVFAPQPGAVDRTDEVLAAWRRWLHQQRGKE